jgi:AcrR family transcriptional regulator
MTNDQNSRDNQRTRLSKQLLQNALVELLAEKSIHKISVREICAAADINRTTFYKYYGSQYDLLVDIENEILAQIERRLSAPISANNGMQIMKQLLDFILDNVFVCKVLVNNNVDPQFPEKLLNLPRIKQVFIASMETNYNDTQLDYLFDLIANGCFAVIKNWLNKEDRESVESMAALLMDIILRMVR